MEALSLVMSVIPLPFFGEKKKKKPHREPWLILKLEVDTAGVKLTLPSELRNYQSSRGSPIFSELDELIPHITLL